MRSLLTADGWALLESLPPYAESQAMALAERLRTQGHSAEVVSAAMTQSRLRAKGQEKLGPFAQAMLLTAEGLEQSSRLAVAAHHARRFVSADIARVADLGCGLGSDAMAFASLDRAVLAIDSDELTAAFATVNLRHWEHAEVRCHDVLTLDLPGMFEQGDGLWFDPSRRVPTGPGGRGPRRRTVDPEAASPPLSFVLDAAAHFPATGAKLAPGIPHSSIPSGTEAQWISVAGQALECGLWFGPLARPGVSRSALLIRDGATHEVLGTTKIRPEVAPIGSFLFEPDPAIIAAALVGDVAGTLGLTAIDPTIAYLSGNRPVNSPLVKSYTIEEVMPYHLKSLRATLRNRGIGPLTIKKRGTSIDPIFLRRQLRLTGTTEATIALTTISGRPQVIFLRALP